MPSRSIHSLIINFLYQGLTYNILVVYKPLVLVIIITLKFFIAVPTATLVSSALRTNSFQSSHYTSNAVLPMTSVTVTPTNTANFRSTPLLMIVGELIKIIKHCIRHAHGIIIIHSCGLHRWGGYVSFIGHNSNNNIIALLEKV